MSQHRESPHEFEGPGEASLVPLQAQAAPGSQHDHLCVRLFGGRAKVVRARFAGEDLELERVSTSALPTREGPQGLSWDVDALRDDILRAVRLVVGGSGTLRSLSVTGFGADYAVLDEAGTRCAPAFSHQGARGHASWQALLQRVPEAELLRRTGVPPRPYQTAPRWFEQVQEGRWPEAARHLLLLPDLLHHALCGVIAAERSAAASTNLLSVHTGDWDRELATRLGLPAEVLPALVDPGTVLGPMHAEYGPGLRAEVQIMAGLGDETACAVAALPESVIFVRGGSFARIGRCLPAGAGDTAREEGSPPAGDAAGARPRFLTPTLGGRMLEHVEAMGTWVLDECARMAELHGRSHDFDEALGVQGDLAGVALLDLDHPRLQRPLHMVEAIREVLAESGQSMPGDAAGLRACLFASLVVHWSARVDELAAAASPAKAPVVMFGPGKQSTVFLQALADATDREWSAGPDEALGNLLLQACASGRFTCMDEARDLAARALPRRRLLPTRPGRWSTLRSRLATLRGRVRAAGAR